MGGGNGDGITVQVRMSDHRLFEAGEIQARDNEREGGSDGRRS